MLSAGSAKVAFLQGILRVFMVLTILSYLAAPSLFFFLCRNIAYRSVVHVGGGATIRGAFFITVLPGILAIVQHVITEPGDIGIFVDFFGPPPYGISKIFVISLDIVLMGLGVLGAIAAFQPTPSDDTFADLAENEASDNSDTSEEEDALDEGRRDVDSTFTIHVMPTIRAYWGTSQGGETDPPAATTASRATVLPV